MHTGGKDFQRCRPDPLRRRVCGQQRRIGIFQRLQFPKEPVVFGIRNARRIQHIIGVVMPFKLGTQFSSAGRGHGATFTLKLRPLAALDAAQADVEIRALTEQIDKELPKGTKMEVTRDGGEEAQSNLNNVIESLLFGAVLTIFVVYVFLNSWRSTLITALSLPTSVITAFIAVWLAGFTLNFMTLLGLSLAIGVLIDDAIVVRENIVRHLNAGAARLQAASEGTKEIGLAVLATTCSIIAVFIPVAFMGGGAGEWFRPFALTVASSVLVSLFISFTLDPMLSAYWGDPPGAHSLPRRGLGGLLQRFNVWFDHQANRYGRVISWALKHRRWMTLIAVGSMVAAVGLQVQFGGSSFLPASDEGTLAVDIRTPSSSSLEYDHIKVEQAAALARALPETIATNSNVYQGGGRIYVDIGKTSQRKRKAREVAADLRKRVSGLVGAEFVVLDDLNNGVRKPVQIQFSGPDARKLMELTSAYMEKLRAVPGAVDVGLSEQDPKDELQIELDRGLANALGVSVADAAQTLRVAFAGVEVGDWIDPTGQARDVAVRRAQLAGIAEQVQTGLHFQHHGGCRCRALCRGRRHHHARGQAVGIGQLGQGMARDPPAEVHHKFVATVAGDDIGGTFGDAANRPGDIAQAIITSLVSIGVVIELEVVNITHDQGNAAQCATGTTPFTGNGFVKKSPVGNTGEAVTGG